LEFFLKTFFATRAAERTATINTIIESITFNFNYDKIIFPLLFFENKIVIRWLTKLNSDIKLEGENKNNENFINE